MTNYSASFRKKLGLVSLVILATQLPCSLANAMDLPMKLEEEQPSKKRERSLTSVEIEEEQNHDTKRQKLSSDDSQIQDQGLLLKSQLENVSKFVEHRKSQALPIKMVFGAVNKDCERINDESFIYLDDESQASHDSQGKPHVTASFNDLDQLSKIAHVVGSNIDQIVMDDSTYKFAEWTSSHLQMFSSMLKKDGEFMFPSGVARPGAGDTYTISHAKEIDDILRNANNNAKLFSFDRLPKSFDAPTFMPVLDLEAPEVIEEYNKYLPLEKFENLSYDQYWDKLDELKIKEHFFPPALGLELESEVLKLSDGSMKNSNLKESIALRLQSKSLNTGISEKIHKAYYHPHIKTVLEQHFEKVELRENTTLPFPSQWNNTILYLMFAKNPK